MTSVTREQAKAEGLRFYNAGKPCKRCGGVERYRNNSGCVSCNAARYVKNNGPRKRAHPGKTHIYGNPCIKDPSHIDKSGKTKRYSSGHRCVACVIALESKNNETRKQKHAGKVHYHGSPCTIDPDHVDENGQTKRLVNGNNCVACVAVRTANYPKEKKYSLNSRRRAKKKNALVPLTRFERRQENYLYYWAKLLTKLTGIDHEVDHIWPLDAGGLHHPINLQVLTAQENQSKRAKLLLDLITPENLSLHKEKGLLHNIHIIGKL